MERKTRFATPKFATKILTLLAPAMLPRLAPAEMIPKSLVLSSLLKTSVSKLQAEEKAKEIKNANPHIKHARKPDKFCGVWLENLH